MPGCTGRIWISAQVMIECLQNHTPDVIIVDEIGRKQEVQAARDVGNRGAVVCEWAE
jgi:stage III sporulation protein SpoIIIAA